MNKTSIKRLVVAYSAMVFIVLGISVISIILINEHSKPLEPGYPKEIVRESYSFTARDIEEETQLKDFLGIKPAGEDIDIWLGKKDLAGLEQWKDYWFDIFGSYGRADLLTFISNKFVEYKITIPKLN